MATLASARSVLPHAVTREAPDRYIVSLDVPGFTADELAAELQGLRLTVRGVQTAPARPEDQVLRVLERVEASVLLPDDVDPDAVTVTLDHGTLVVNAPRVDQPTRRLPIEHACGRVSPRAVAC